MRQKIISLRLDAMTEIKNIDTILFDLGGVLLDVSYERTVAAFKANGVANFDALYTQAKQDHLFDQFEVGAISPSEFRDEVRARTGIGLSDEAINDSWNAILGTLPQERVQMIERLKERYQVLLLSNTNAIHVEAFSTLIHEQNGIADFKSLFHGAYYSNEIGMRKPNEEVFNYVLEKHDASPNSTLFIDDTQHHVDGSIAAGLNGYFLDLSKEDVVKAMTVLGFT